MKLKLLTIISSLVLSFGVCSPNTFAKEAEAVADTNYASPGNCAIDSDTGGCRSGGDSCKTSDGKPGVCSSRGRGCECAETKALYLFLEGEEGPALRRALEALEENSAQAESPNAITSKNKFGGQRPVPAPIPKPPACGGIPGQPGMCGGTCPGLMSCQTNARGNCSCR